MSRSEEKIKYVDYSKFMDKIQDSSCNQCKGEKPPSFKNAFNPTDSVVNTIGFNPTNRNFNYEDIDDENKLLFSTVNREKKEMIESEMPQLDNNEAFGSISSNSFEPSESSSAAFYDGSNDVMRGIMQEYNRVKDKGEFYTFKSTPRRKNIDLSAYMSPPDKILGRGFGDVNMYEKIYLGQDTRMNAWRPIEGSAPRINDVPYYLTALPVFKDLGGSDTRYLNMKIRG
jgi:hypothetical protein